MSEFKNSFAQNIFDSKYANYEGQTWKDKAGKIVDDVTHNTLNAKDRGALYDAIRAVL